jgi:small basic protein
MIIKWRDIMQDHLYQIMVNALLSALGAMARQLHVMHKEVLRPATFISGCFIAAFMGVMIFFFTDHLSLSGNIAYAAAGISGWIGPRILDMLGQNIMRIVGVHDEDVKNKYNSTKEKEGKR